MKFFHFIILTVSFLICQSLLGDICFSDEFIAEFVDDNPEKVELTYTDYSDCHYCENDGHGGHCQSQEERMLLKVLRADSIDGFRVLELTSQDQLINNVDICTPAGKYTYLILDFDTENDSKPGNCDSDCEKDGDPMGTESNFFEIEVPNHSISCVEKGQELSISQEQFENLKYQYGTDNDYNPDETPDLISETPDENESQIQDSNTETTDKNYAETPDDMNENPDNENTSTPSDDENSADTDGCSILIL